MPDNNPKKKRTFYTQFYTQYSVEQYKESSDVVKKANDTYIKGFEAILDDYNQLQTEVREKESDNIVLNETIANIRKFQFVAAIFTIVGLVLIGIGINKLTASPPDFGSGWALICCGAVVQLVAASMFFLIPKSRGKN